MNEKRFYNSNGVGLRFDGMPTNIRQFYFILAEQGCHPKATHRILNRINKNGFDLLTVMSGLDFNWIEKQLKLIGVKMIFIIALDDWTDKYKDGEWPEWALPEHIKQSRIKQSRIK